MSKMSDLITNAFKAVGRDIKTLFGQFDASGRLLKSNLPALTKEDVGLSNVDNTADSNKAVLSATKLTTPRKIALTGGVTGSVNFNGSVDTSIPTVLDKLAVRAAFGGYNVVSPTSADTLVRNFAVGGKMVASGDIQSDAPFGVYTGVVETFCGINSSEKLQIAYTYDNAATVGNIDYYYGQRIGFVYRRFPVSNPTADQLKWIPISSSLLTYKTTTNAPPNVYIDKDGVLKRSTYVGSAPVRLSVKLGDSTNNFITAVAHGLDVSKISNVYARCNIDTNGDYNWIPDNFIQTSSGGVQYLYFYTVRATSSILYIEVHPQAYTMHGKPIDIFIETTA